MHYVPFVGELVKLPQLQKKNGAKGGGRGLSLGANMAKERDEAKKWWLVDEKGRGYEKLERKNIK
jgi:hypothetical protein